MVAGGIFNVLRHIRQCLVDNAHDLCLSHIALQTVSKYACQGISAHNTDQQPSLKGLGDVFRPFLFPELLFAEKCHNNQRKTNGNSVSDHHKGCAFIYEGEGRRCVIQIEQEDQQHMDILAYAGDSHTVGPGRLLIIEHQIAQKRRNAADKDDRHRTGKSGVIAGSQKESEQSANHTRNNACGRTEHQPGAQRRRIGYIDDHILKGDAMPTGKYRKPAKQDADDQLLYHIRKLLYRRMLFHQIEKHDHGGTGQNRNHKVHTPLPFSIEFGGVCSSSGETVRYSKGNSYIGLSSVRIKALTALGISGEKSRYQSMLSRMYLRRNS